MDRDCMQSFILYLYSETFGKLNGVLDGKNSYLEYLKGKGNVVSFENFCSIFKWNISAWHTEKTSHVGFTDAEE